MASGLPWIDEITGLETLKKTTVETSYSTIRQRLLEQQSRRIDRELSRRATSKLQDGRSRLSDPDISIGDLKAAQSRLRNGMTYIEHQNDAARKERERFNELAPLEQQAEIKRAVHRSDREREAVIAGSLKRERNQRMKLTRGQFDRVQARAAAYRRLLDAKAFEKTGRRPVERVALGPKGQVHKVRRDGLLRKVSICEERERRKESMFAIGVIGRKSLFRNHRVPYETRKNRKELMHFVRCM